MKCPKCGYAPTSRLGKTAIERDGQCYFCTSGRMRGNRGRFRGRYNE